MSPQNSIDVKTSVYDAIIHLFNYDLGTLVVVENEKLVGIISRKDLLKATLNKKNIEKTPVSMIMTRMPNIVHCFEDDNIMDAIEKLIKHEIDSLPVLRKENGKLSLVGRFTKTNVTGALAGVLLHNKVLTIKDIKKALHEAGIVVRL